MTTATALLVLVLSVAALLAILRLFQISNDIRKIREHLDRAVPDFIKANKERVREKLKGDGPEAKP